MKTSPIGMRRHERAALRTALESAGFLVFEVYGQRSRPGSAPRILGRPHPPRPPDATHGGPGGLPALSAVLAKTSRKRSS